MQRLTLSQVITELQQHEQEHGNDFVVVFANGDLFPVLGVQNFEGEIEIGCGWGTQ